MAVVIGVLMGIGASNAYACHTAAHCAQEEVEQRIQEIGQEVEQKIDEAEEQAELLKEQALALVRPFDAHDVYACVLEGRTDHWTIAGAPLRGEYRFVGEATCAHLDRNAATDGGDDTGTYTGTFMLVGDHAQPMFLPACGLVQWDGLHEGVASGEIDLSGDTEGPIAFNHGMTSSAGVGLMSVADDGSDANGLADGYGAATLVATDAVEGPAGQVGCLTSTPPGFFIEAGAVIGVFPSS